MGGAYVGPTPRDVARSGIDCCQTFGGGNNESGTAAAVNAADIVYLTHRNGNGCCFRVFEKYIDIVGRYQGHRFRSDNAINCVLSSAAP